MIDCSNVEDRIEIALGRRAEWLAVIREEAVGDFVSDGDHMATTLAGLRQTHGPEVIYDHLLVSGVIPEALGHDSTEEKLFSKYTDILLALAFSELGLEANAIDRRGDAADVEGTCSEFSLAADAKAFRLSRTAKNQKDFKIESLAGWRREMTYSTLVGPLHQFPSQRSQIYEQATRRGVAILSFVHLRVLLRAKDMGRDVIALFRELLEAPERVPEKGKDAQAYWATVNDVLRNAGTDVAGVWRQELEIEAEMLARLRALEISEVRAEIAKLRDLPPDEAIERLIVFSGLPKRIQVIAKSTENATFEY